jgi:hypothetical protein
MDSTREPPRPDLEDTPARRSSVGVAVYRGQRTEQRCVVTVDGENLPRRYDLLSASPSGFEWGYGGSGPAQLAIAVLAHAYDDEVATTHYQQFKREVVAGLPEEDWILTKTNLDTWREEVIGDA